MLLVLEVGVYDALVLGDPSSIVHNVLPRVPRWQGGALATVFSWCFRMSLHEFARPGWAT